MVDNLNYRENIILVARKFVGCHYLWGAAGARPGSRDGADYRPGGVTLDRPSLDPSSPCLNAAICSQNATGEVYRCAGRWRKAPHGRITDPRDDDLVEFLSRFRAEGWGVYMAGYQDEKRAHYLNLTPRKVLGSNVSEYDGGGQPVWGEDCRWIRHFDCIGFINYVLDETTSAPYGTYKVKAKDGTLKDVQVQGWSNDIAGWVKSAQPIPLTDAPVPGDILFRRHADGGWGHIAFLGGDNKVLQAEGAAYGVHDHMTYLPVPTSRNANGWDARGRLSGAFFNTSGVVIG